MLLGALQDNVIVVLPAVAVKPVGGIWRSWASAPYWIGACISEISRHACYVGYAPATQILVEGTSSIEHISICVTLLTSHFEISPLKAVALENILLISVTLLTSHAEMFPLKAVAWLNISFIFVTLLTSHEEISALKVPLFLNKLFISVIPLVQVVAAFASVI